MTSPAWAAPPPQATLKPPSTPPLRCLVFTIVAGAFLGMGAGLSQGAIMTSYPPHDRKGTYISLFWSIFNMGDVIGGLIPFVLNFHRTEAVSVNDVVVRDDGSWCTNIKYSSVSVEAGEILKLFLDGRMLLMVPASWASNFFCYQFNNVNGMLFNLRTRGFNNIFYWGV